MDAGRDEARILDIISPNDNPLFENQIISSIPYLEFNEANRANIPRTCFVKTSLDINSLGVISDYFHQQLTSRNIANNFPSVMLALAVHLKGQDGQFILSDYKPIGKDNRMRYTLLVPEDYIPHGEYLQNNVGDNRGISTLLNLSSDSDDEDMEDDWVDRGRFTSQEASFLAAYLFKLLSKTSDNVFGGLRNMRTRYRGFYKGEVMSSILTTRSTIEKIRILLNGAPIIRVSWVETIANFESSTNQLSEDAGMLRYLANLPLGYTGMHAYSMLLDLKGYVDRPFQWILTQLFTPEHREAILEIKKILNTHERCVEFPDRPTHFKYARLYSPSFFLPLHSKRCTSLLYLLTKLLSQFKKEDEFGGPNAIIAISQVGGANKHFLDRYAKNIYDLINQDDGARFYSAAARQARDEEEEEDIPLGNLIDLAAIDD
ncbi:TPA_asm: N [Cypripedium betacytorhabdovirus 1]|nr:TPA_asm: N [Cypripedium betacytorhabdovirus 1]